MDLALIGNGSFQVLIDSRGSVQWLCWPRFDSSFVIGPLIDADKGGAFSIQAAEEGFQSTQRYLESTAIAETVWSKAGESFSVTDFAPRYYEGATLHRPRQLIRRIRRLEGSPQLRFHFAPVYDYGRAEPPAGLLHLQCSSAISSGKAFSLEGDVYLVLSWQEPLKGSLDSECRGLLERTQDYWTRWADRLDLPERYRSEVLRSAITLKLHQYDDTGALSAAATTSIPEHAGSGRNWDYRFCWPRDSYFSVDALHLLGCIDESKRYVRYLQMIAARDASFQPLYGLAGEQRIEEEILTHLSGYRGDGPVRIGNQAYEQDQHDIYGEMVAAIEPVYRSQPTSDLRALLLRLLDEVEKHFAEPDAGLWEKRNEPARHSFSLLMHWVAARSVRDLGVHTQDSELSERGASIMERARRCLDEECWNESRGYYAETVGGAHADASLLFMINVGYLRPGDARALRHLRGLAERLQGAEGLFRRYLHDDGLGETLSSFTVCTLWYAEALARLGERAESERVLESVLRRTNHVGLLSEDIDPVDGSLWGNFPQTYSHVGIIRCALALSHTNNS